VPSSDADSSTRPLAGPKHTAVTGAAWSLSVTKQKPLPADQSFTLASSAPVAITVPVGGRVGTEKRRISRECVGNVFKKTFFSLSL
jgi:hypothetical protein